MAWTDERRKDIDIKRELGSKEFSSTVTINPGDEFRTCS
jgi:hypothetical protein